MSDYGLFVNLCLFLDAFHLVQIFSGTNNLLECLGPCPYMVKSVPKCLSQEPNLKDIVAGNVVYSGTANKHF